MLDRFEEFTFLISRINKDIQKIKLHQLKKYGLNGSQMEFIYYLGKYKELSFKEFCKVLNYDKAFVSRNLNLLKKQNLLIENFNQNNKTIYSLNEQGIEIFRSNKQKTEQICKTVYLEDNKKDSFYNNLIEISNKLHKIGDDMS